MSDFPSFIQEVLEDKLPIAYECLLMGGSVIKATLCVEHIQQLEDWSGYDQIDIGPRTTAACHYCQWKEENH